VSVLAVVVILNEYGGGSFFPGLIASFIATLFAFVLALWWERKREQRELAKGAAELERRHATEVRRRFAPIRAELVKDEESLRFLGERYRQAARGRTVPLDMQLLHPQLLEGAWIANAPRLSELVADYDLIGDLATTYGRIEELRWRLRNRSTTTNLRVLDDMTAPLVYELEAEVADLLERVGAQIEQPTVQPAGLLHKGKLDATVGLTGSISAVVVRAGDSARSLTGGSSEEQ
jgi:hypothetical protein